VKKIITIGGATQDVFIHINNADTMQFTHHTHPTNFFLFESGTKVDIDDIVYTSGGGATNTATSFKRFGIDVEPFCLIGFDAAGRHILEDLAQEKISTRLIVKQQDYPTGTSYILNAPAMENTLFVYRGANNFLSLESIEEEELSKTSYLYLTSLACSTCKELEGFLKRAKNQSVQIVMNPGLSQLVQSTDIIKKALSYTDIFILNTTEAKTLMLTLVESDEKYRFALKSSSHDKQCPTDVPLDEPSLLQYPIATEHLFFSIQNFFKEVLTLGCKTVVITNGANGVYVAHKDMLLFHPSLPTEIVDTVGAGDAFGSTFTASIAQGYTLADALRNGIINSASVISKRGSKAGLLTRKEIDKRRKVLAPSLLQTFTW
jgi:sugar/nucleoside kinase (ribokinase family)